MSGMTIGQFIGGWAFDRNRTLCAVGRPFSGDVPGIGEKPERDQRSETERTSRHLHQESTRL